ncbi:MAG: hypothetical protein WDA18_04670, partial [Candidatus Ratteibacteria bacterium]
GSCGPDKGCREKIFPAIFGSEGNIKGSSPPLKERKRRVRGSSPRGGSSKEVADLIKGAGKRFSDYLGSIEKNRYLSTKRFFILLLSVWFLKGSLFNLIKASSMDLYTSARVREAEIDISTSAMKQKIKE